MNRQSRVFISYSHEGEVHDERVLTLSQRLRKDGFDCHVDQYDPNPKQGWPRWMVEQIDRADYILLVCTETYCRRVMGEEASGVGYGVIWEANLIYQYIYDNGTLNERFVPILLGEAKTGNIPPPLRGSTHYRVSVSDVSDAGYVRLCEFMRGEHRVTMAPLGSRRPLQVDSERSAALVTEAEAGDAAAVVDSLCNLLLDKHDPSERYWIYLTLGTVGGKKARRTLKQSEQADDDEFARMGAKRALQILEQTQSTESEKGETT